jgi:FkbM family methyltransferase
LFSKLVGEGGAVHAFEPTSYAFDRLRQNLALNAELSSRIVLNQAGLLDAPAEREEAIESQFSLRRPAYSRRERVSFTTLERYCELKRIDAIDVIKIDVDGYDQDVVLGGKNILSRCRPLVLCEFCDRVLRDHGTSLASYLGLYGDLGYDRYLTRLGEPPRPLSELLREPGIADRTVNALLLAPRDR